MSRVLGGASAASGPGCRLRGLAIALACLAASASAHNVVYVWETFVEKCGNQRSRPVNYWATRFDAAVAPALASVSSAAGNASVWRELRDDLAACRQLPQNSSEGDQQSSPPALTQAECVDQWRQDLVQFGFPPNDAAAADQMPDLTPGWASVAPKLATPDMPTSSTQRISKVGVATASSAAQARDEALSRMEDYFGAMLSTMIRLSDDSVCSATSPRLVGLVYLPGLEGAAAEIEDRSHRALTHFRSWDPDTSDTPPNANACDMSQDLDVIRQQTPRVRQTGTTEINREPGAFASAMVFHCSAKYIEYHYQDDTAGLYAWAAV